MGILSIWCVSADGPEVQCSQSDWSLEKPIAKQPHTVLATPAVIPVKFWSQIPRLARLLSPIRLRGDKWATAICRRRWGVRRLTPDWSLLLRWLQNLTSVFFPTGWKIWISCIMPQLRPDMSNYDIDDEVFELGPVCTHLDMSCLPSGFYLGLLSICHFSLPCSLAAKQRNRWVTKIRQTKRSCTSAHHLNPLAPHLVIWLPGANLMD